MKRAYLMLGGNEGDRMKNILEAEKMIAEAAGKIIRSSAVYQTKAWGKTDQPDYYNRAVEIETPHSPSKLIETLLNIETTMGRIRQEKWSQRLIDIDIIFYEDQIIDEPGLQVPHPHMASRRFVLAPVNEIAGNVIHPRLKKTVRELLRECPDTLAALPLNEYEV